MTGALGRVRFAAVLLVVAAPLVLAACASSGYHYVKSTQDKTYFKVPDSWKLYDQESVLNALKGALSKDEIAQRRATSWTTVFDANPDPSLNHVASNRPNYPVGRAIVQPLSSSASDGASLQSLRNIFFDVDTGIDSGAATVKLYAPVELAGGFHGSHLVANMTGKSGAITFNQIAVFDQGTSKVYAISIYCTTACYDKYESKINTVIDSWTVRAS
jgi:hypothetical protein